LGCVCRPCKHSGMAVGRAPDRRRCRGVASTSRRRTSPRSRSRETAKSCRDCGHRPLPATCSRPLVWSPGDVDLSNDHSSLAGCSAVVGSEELHHSRAPTSLTVQIVSPPPDQFCIQNRRFRASSGADGAQPGHGFAQNSPSGQQDIDRRRSIRTRAIAPGAARSSGRPAELSAWSHIW